MAQHGLPHHGRDDRPRRHAGDAARGRPLEGARHRLLSSILYNPPVPGRVARRCLHRRRTTGSTQALDYKLIDHAQEALENGTPVEIKLPIRNVHRTVGAMLSGEIARRYGSAGLPDDTIRFQFTGSAGQSFGAFLCQRRDA